jgi:hypothetical protein
MRMAAAALLAVLIAGATLIDQTVVVLADGGWLDAEPPMRWNAARAPLPGASAGFTANTTPACAGETRTAESDEDRAVVAAGYYLAGQYVAGWDLKAILGASGFDDVCGPLDYNYFIFANGIFAGTVSPVVMNSGTDGAAVDVRIVGSDQLTVRFLRSGPGDQSCCPSRESTGTYSISRLPGSPVLLLESATEPE